MSERERFLTFSIADEEFAIPLLKVREVIAVPTITPVPNSSPDFRGVMNLRGKVISVVDLRIRFSAKSSRDPAAENAVIVLDLAGSTSLGILVDAVSQVMAPSPEKIQPAPNLDSRLPEGCITAITQAESGLIFILDIDKTIETSRLQRSSA
ncbi:MAG: chemotaxis protein CheW [Bdellovibrionota bacterium]